MILDGRKNQRGFGAIEALIIILILAAVSGGGYYIWHKNNAKKASSKSATSTSETSTKTTTKITEKSADKYDGWSSYTLKYEKISLKYPANYTLADTSYADNFMLVTPGLDVVKISAPNDLLLVIQTGLYGIGAACESCQVASVEKSQVLGKDRYFIYVTNPVMNSASVGISDSQTDFVTMIDGKNVTVKEDGATAPMSITIKYKDNRMFTMADLNNDADYVKIRLILESLSY